MKFASDGSTNSDPISGYFRDIVIAIVAVVQALAFAKLAGVLPSIVDQGRLVDYAAFFLGFMVLLRLFQTHMLAAIKYVGVWQVQATDLAMIFVVGFFEFFLLNTIDGGATDVNLLMKSIFAFSGLGVIGYYRSYRAVAGQIQDIASLKAERRVQLSNIRLSIVAGLPAMLWLFSYYSGLDVRISFDSLATACLAASSIAIWRSITQSLRLTLT